jgi:hypothetical protein
VRKTNRIVIGVLLPATFLLAAVTGHAQLPRDPQERARVLAQIMQFNARQLTLFDRQGEVVSLIGPRDLYNQPVLSPDAQRVAVIKSDVEKETNDLWVLELATGTGVRITTSTQAREGSLQCRHRRFARLRCAIARGKL